MGCGQDKGSAGRGHCEAQSMIDDPRGNFVMTRQANKYRQARGIRRSPGIRMLLVDCQIPDGCGVCAPRATLRDCAMKEFVEPAPVFFKHQHVPVAVAGLWITFYQGVARDGLRARITLAGIKPKRNVHLGLFTRYDLVRDANSLAVERPSAEIGMQCNGGTNEVDNVGRVRIYGS